MSKQEPATGLAVACQVMQLFGVLAGVCGVVAGLIVWADGRRIEGAEITAASVVVAILFVFLACWARAWQDVAVAAGVQQPDSLQHSPHPSSVLSRE